MRIVFDYNKVAKTTPNKRCNYYPVFLRYSKYVINFSVYYARFAS